MKEESVKVGNVIKNKYGMWVITQIVDGEVVDVQDIDNWICDVSIIEESNGEYKTIRQIVEERKRLYLEKANIVNE